MALNTGNSLFWKTGLDTKGLQSGALKSKGILAGLSKSITRMDVFAGLAIGSALAFAKYLSKPIISQKTLNMQ